MLASRNQIEHGLLHLDEATISKSILLLPIMQRLLNLNLEVVRTNCAYYLRNVNKLPLGVGSLLKNNEFGITLKGNFLFTGLHFGPLGSGK